MEMRLEEWAGYILRAFEARQRGYELYPEVSRRL